MPYIINENNYSTIFMGLLFVLLTAVSAQAGSPVIIRHDAHLMERDIRINIAWQSEEPVVKIIASAGKEQVVVQEGIDNDRNEGGYSGEIDIVLPAYPNKLTGEQSLYMSRQNSSQFQQSSTELYANTTPPYTEVVQYSIQLVDEVNQRSTLLNDKVHRLDQASSKRNLHGSQQPQQSPMKTVTIDTKDPLNTALNTTIGLIGKIGANPVIKDAKVSFWTENRVSINFNAIDDKGVDKVVFEVRDARGNLAHQDSLLCSSEKQCSQQTDTFVLNTGKYVLTAFAVDTENNNSKKVTVEFQVANSGQQLIEQAPQQMINQPNPQQTAPDVSPPDDVPVVSIPGL